jgi:hypothetical protein
MYLAALAFASAAVVVPAAAGSAAAPVPAMDPGPVAVQQVRVPAHGLRDEVAMVLVGTALITLAAAVRRAA